MKAEETFSYPFRSFFPHGTKRFLEDSLNWQPRVCAAHRSIASFRPDLQVIHGIPLSRMKTRKLLISGSSGSTE